MKIKIEEMVRATEDDQVELEGKVFRTKDPNEGEYGWSQFIVVKDDTGEQACWLKLGGEGDKVSKGDSITVKGKVGKEYKDKRDKTARSVNNCEFGVKQNNVDKGQVKTQETTNGTKDNYWEKKFKYEIQRDPKVQLAIARQCAIKAVTELTTSASKVMPIKSEKDYFESADKIVSYIYKDIDLMADVSVALLGGETSEETQEETKEELIEKARETVKSIQKKDSEERFRPASTLQKNKIFGFRDEKGWHKGMIESRYITKEEIREIGDPKNLSVEKASKWLGFWWGEGEEIGERAKREIEAQDKDPIKKHLEEKNEPLVKGDKTSLAKDVLVDRVNALRRENFLMDDEKFKKEIGYNPKLEELTEAELTKLKEILEHYNPSWTEEE